MSNAQVDSLATRRSALATAVALALHGGAALPQQSAETPADSQIRASGRVLLEFADLAPRLAGRACAPAARLLHPDWVGPIPGGLPAVS